MPFSFLVDTGMPLGCEWECLYLLTRDDSGRAFTALHTCDIQDAAVCARDVVVSAECSLEHPDNEHGLPFHAGADRRRPLVSGIRTIRSAGAVSLLGRGY